jgi:hypothetical protein
MIIHDVEQNSEEWYKLRAGIPTASMFSKLVTSKGEISKSLETYAYTLAAEKWAGGDVGDFDGNQWTERGHELEDEARKSYEFIKEIEAVKVGFITNNSKTMGCSPDYLVGEDGMLEVKCLKATTHIETILYFDKHKKAPPKYFQQKQGQVMIAEKKWCDLYFYHPKLPPLTIRQFPDDDFQMKLLKAIDIANKRRDEIIKVMESI